MQDIMERMDIAFPHLGIYLRNVPKSFSVFEFPIALYGVIIAVGVLAGVLLAAYVAKLEKLDPDVIWDFAIYAIIFSIIGGRIYYVIFSWDRYKDHLLDVFNTRKGGMAIYGAVIAAFLTLWIYCRKKKQSFLRMADICVPGLVLGQVIGRWGNFVNREVFGRYTDGLFAMRLPITDVRSRDVTLELAEHMFTDGVNYIQVMPTFLYESVLNLIVFLIMILYRKHKKFQGEIALIYLGGYGIIRFVIEGLRTDRLLLWNTNIAVSQLLGMLLFLFAVGAEIVVRVIRMTRQKVLAGMEEDMQEKWGQTESSRTEEDQAESSRTEDEQEESP